MIDLSEAGRRLADTQVGSTPPIEALDARRLRRARRRRYSLLAAAAVVVAAAVSVPLALTARSPGTQRVVTGPPKTANPLTTEPAGLGVSGSIPYDYLRVRLWLPPGWTTSTSTCHWGNHVVYFPADFAGATQLSCVIQPSNNVVVSSADTTVPPAAPSKTINGITVFVTQHNPEGTTWDVPSLQVQVAFSAASQSVVDTLQASPLEDLLTQNFPTSPIPQGWRTITYDGFQAKVPSSWPTHRIVTTTSGNTSSVSGFPPGICAPPTFHTPAVYLGDGFISCPIELETTEPPTDDGLWLQPSSDTTPLSSQLQANNSGGASTPQRLLNIGSLQVLISASSGDSVFVQLEGAGKRIDANIGLGRLPSVAEAIISSIKPI